MKVVAIPPSLFFKVPGKAVKLLALNSSQHPSQNHNKPLEVVVALFFWFSTTRKRPPLRNVGHRLKKMSTLFLKARIGSLHSGHLSLEGGGIKSWAQAVVCAQTPFQSPPKLNQGCTSIG